jgi:GNAT superfamily N-acetyltransferase
MTASDRSGHQAALDAARRLGNNRHVSTPTTSSTAPATTAQRPAAILVEPLAAPPAETDRRAPVDLLVECVGGGASIGFLAPLAPDEAEAYWAKILGDLAGGFRVLLVARDPATRGIVGAAQLACEARANGRHCGEVQKVMVLPSHRRRGIGERLMAAIEAAARTRGLTLLFLDTSDSHAGARAFYAALDYVFIGGIPGYALDPHGRPEPNAIFYKTLAPRA